MRVLQLAERSRVPSSQTEALLGGVVAPRPDMTNLIKALIGKAQTARELVQVCTISPVVLVNNFSLVACQPALMLIRPLPLALPLVVVPTMLAWGIASAKQFGRICNMHPQQASHIPPYLLSYSCWSWSGQQSRLSTAPLTAPALAEPRGGR